MRGPRYEAGRELPTRERFDLVLARLKTMNRISVIPAEASYYLMLRVEEMGDPEYLDWAKRHRKVIQRFGRFPHRNGILGRKSTDEETQFLEQPGSSF